MNGLTLAELRLEFSDYAAGTRERMCRLVARFYFLEAIHAK